MRDRRARVERAIGRAAWRHLHALRHPRLRVVELSTTHCSAKLLVSPFPVRGADTRIKFQRRFPLLPGALPQKSKMSSKLTVLDVKKVKKARAKRAFEAKPLPGEG